MSQAARWPVGSGSTATVTYTSDYLNFASPGNSYALSLASITPALSIGPGGLLNSFTANIAGQFTGNPVPEPAALALLACAPLVLRRRSAGSPGHVCCSARSREGMDSSERQVPKSPSRSPGMAGPSHEPGGAAAEAPDGGEPGPAEIAAIGSPPPRR